MNQRWEYKQTTDNAILRSFFDQGWEPFAVTFEHGVRHIHLRKLFTPSPERIGLDA